MVKQFGMMLTPLMKEFVNRNPKLKPEDIINDDDRLRECDDLEHESNAGSLSTNLVKRRLHGRHDNPDADSSLEDLRSELQEDLETAMKNNFELFNRKFEMQKKAIVDELSKLINRESDRVIEELSAGPYERILDKASVLTIFKIQVVDNLNLQQIYAIWKEMVSHWYRFLLLLLTFLFLQELARKR